MVEQRNDDDRPDDWDLVDDNLTSTSTLITGLTTQDEYTFRVYASNKVGWSKPSKCSAAVVVKGKGRKCLHVDIHRDLDRGLNLDAKN